jgi:hypothetical protein
VKLELDANLQSIFASITDSLPENREGRQQRFREKSALKIFGKNYVSDRIIVGCKPGLGSS